MSSETKLEEILERWDNAREKMNALSNSIDTYKECVSRLMNKRGTNSLSVGKYKVVRSRTTRSTMSKKNVPSEIWHKYSTDTSFDTLTLKHTP